MCDCPDSPWVRDARAFLDENQNNPEGLWHTVDFLIRNNHCGINNRVDIESILSHLGSHGIWLSREEFQQTILGELKRLGIVATLVYPGPQGGVFIPCNEDEVRRVAVQILDRINSEIENVDGVAHRTPFGNLFVLLRQIITWVKENI